MSSYTISDVPIPAGVAVPDGAVRAEDWQPSGTAHSKANSVHQQPHQRVDPRAATRRRLHRRRHPLGGPRHRRRRVHWEDSMDAETARRLAHLLVTAADEVVGGPRRARRTMSVSGPSSCHENSSLSSSARCCWSGSSSNTGGSSRSWWPSSRHANTRRRCGLATKPQSQQSGAGSLRSRRAPTNSTHGY